MSKKRWTKEDVAYLKEHYANIYNSELVDYFGKSKDAICQKAIRLGIKKNPLPPKNKGINYCPIKGCIANRLKGIERGINWIPIGSKRKQNGLWRRKISDTGDRNRDWKSIHILLWEACYGPVKEGHIIHFKDGNPDNIRITNLKEVTRADIMLENSWLNYPPELHGIIKARAELHKLIRRKENVAKKKK